jgi:threonine/homoserine/homoserine lactone efflux protein
MQSGIVAGDAFYFFFTAIGLGSLLSISYWAFTAVKWLGICYLVYLGLRSLLYPSDEIVRQNGPTDSGRQAFLTAFTSGNADAVNTQIVELALNAGENIITFSNDHALAPAIDKIEILRP